MHQQPAERTVTLYYLHVIFNEPLFWGPILVTSLQQLAHMSLADIFYMESVVLMLCVVLDVPSGALADQIGRKRAIIVGRLFLVCSAVGFATMSSPVGAWSANILWAIGYTLQSGADTALLYDSLKARRKEYLFTRIEGNAVGSRLLLVACTSLVCGFLAGIDLRLPLYLCVPFMLIPLIAMFRITEPAQTTPYAAHAHYAVLKQGLVFAAQNGAVRWMIGFAAFVAMISKIWFFTYNPYFKLVEVPITEYGVIFFILNIVGWFASRYAYRIEHVLGERRCIVLIVLCLAVPLLIMGLIPIYACAYLVLIQNIPRGFMRPFVGSYINRHITTKENIRATVLSVRSSAEHLCAIVGLFAFGLLSNMVSLTMGLSILGGVAGIIGLFSYACYRARIRGM